MMEDHSWQRRLEGGNSTCTFLDHKINIDSHSRFAVIGIHSGLMVKRGSVFSRVSGDVIKWIKKHVPNAKDTKCQT